MPTYQRLIKKSRLKSVQDFVDNGGFFPNSIIINIDTNGKSVRFDSAGNQVEKSISRIGILHLPKNIDLHILLMDSIGYMVMQIPHIKRQIVFQ